MNKLHNYLKKITYLEEEYSKKETDYINSPLFKEFHKKVSYLSFYFEQLKSSGKLKEQQEEKMWNILDNSDLSEGIKNFLETYITSKEIKKADEGYKCRMTSFKIITAFGYYLKTNEITLKKIINIIETMYKEIKQ